MILTNNHLNYKWLRLTIISSPCQYFILPLSSVGLKRNNKLLFLEARVENRTRMLLRTQKEHACYKEHTLIWKTCWLKHMLIETHVAEISRKINSDTYKSDRLVSHTLNFLTKLKWSITKHITQTLTKLTLNCENKKIQHVWDRW